MPPYLFGLKSDRSTLWVDSKLHSAGKTFPGDSPTHSGNVRTNVLEASWEAANPGPEHPESHKGYFPHSHGLGSVRPRRNLCWQRHCPAPSEGPAIIFSREAVTHLSSWIWQSFFWNLPRTSVALENWVFHKNLADWKSLNRSCWFWFEAHAKHRHPHKPTGQPRHKRQTPERK